MRQEWRTILPLVRPAVAALSALALVLVLVSGVLWSVRLYLTPQWQQAQAQRQDAQAQLEMARAEQADAATYLPRYRQMLAAGLVAGEPRAAWVEDLLQAAAALGLQDQLTFQLAPPEELALPQAQDAQAVVQRHVLQVELRRVHEVEALRMLQQLLARHVHVAQLAGCSFEQPGPDGMEVRCRVNFLHIVPAAGEESDASQ